MGCRAARLKLLSSERLDCLNRSNSSLPLPLLMHGAHCDRPGFFVKLKYTQSNGHPPAHPGLFVKSKNTRNQMDTRQLRPAQTGLLYSVLNAYDQIDTRPRRAARPGKTLPTRHPKSRSRPGRAGQVAVGGCPFYCVYFDFPEGRAGCSGRCYAGLSPARPFVKSKYTQSNRHPPTATGPAQPSPDRSQCLTRMKILKQQFDYVHIDVKLTEYKGNLEVTRSRCSRQK
ncbi:hypothetical protein J6590_094420 [Homalodisca vitripennis]|nr:hypothetical protein J6590_094420 [Homalodisca vitripennis]